MNSIYILFAGEILLLILAYFLTQRDILAPSVLMCIMFIVSTFVVLLNINNWDNSTEGYSIEAVMILLSGILCFIFAETIGRLFFERKRITTKGGIKENLSKVNSFSGLEEIDITMAKIVIVIIADIVICVLYYYAIRNVVGAQYRGLQVFSAYRRLSVADMAGDEETRVGGIVSQLTNFVVAAGYIAAYIFLNNFIAKTKKIHQQWGLILIVIFSVIPGVMTAGRTQFLRLFIAVVIYYYILWNQNYHWKRNLSARFIRIGIISLAIGIPLFYYSLNLIGRSTVSRELGEYVSTYLGGSIFLFGKYIQNPTSCVLWGEETLVGVRKVLSYLGLGATSTSYNLEFRYIDTYRSNVYTFFRRPLHDFGMIGMLVFTALVALFFAYMYWGKIKYANRTDGVNRWTLIYGYFIYWIFISSIDQYSQSIISVGSIVKIILLILGYWFVMKVHIKIKIGSRVIQI